MLKSIGVFLFSFFLVNTAFAVDFKTPWLSGPIVDEVGILRSEQKNELESLIRSFQKRGIAQVQVFVTSSLQGLPIEKASIDIVDQWKLGSAEKDNGVLFLIAPNERKVRIEVGQGLEGVLPDIYTKRINEDIVLPYFKQGQMSDGIYNGTKAILAVLGNENVSDLNQLAHPTAPSQKRGLQLPIWVIILIWIVIIFFGRMGGGGGGRRRFYGGGWGGGFGGGFGSGGGGGWSGGGGGFSGGGSSSSW